MNRRDALKSLAALAGATGLRVTPVTTRDAAAATMVILKSDRRLSLEEQANLKRAWEAATSSTDLQGVKTIVLDGRITVEIVRGRRAPLLERVP